MSFTNFLESINNRLFYTKLKPLCYFLTRLSRIINKRAINKAILKKGSPYYIDPKSKLTILKV